MAKWQHLNKKHATAEQGAHAYRVRPLPEPFCYNFVVIFRLGHDQQQQQQQQQAAAAACAAKAAFGMQPAIRPVEHALTHIRMSGIDAATLASASGAGDWAEVLFEEVRLQLAVIKAATSNAVRVQLGMAIDADQSQKDRCVGGGEMLVFPLPAMLTPSIQRSRRLWYHRRRHQSPAPQRSHNAQPSRSIYTLLLPRSWRVLVHRHVPFQ